MNDSQPCKNCIDLAQKNLAQEIRIRELESQIRYYDNSNSPTYSNSLFYKKQRKSDNPSKLGQKSGHDGTSSSLKPTKTIYYKSENCSSCGSNAITQTSQQTRVIAEIPKPQPVTITKHVIPTYFCKNCGNESTADAPIPQKGNLGFNVTSIILSLWSARITLRNITKMIESFYGIKLSAGTINNSLCNTSDALSPTSKSN